MVVVNSVIYRRKRASPGEKNISAMARNTRQGPIVLWKMSLQRVPGVGCWESRPVFFPLPCLWTGGEVVSVKYGDQKPFPRAVRMGLWAVNNRELFKQPPRGTTSDDSSAQPLFISMTFHRTTGCSLPKARKVIVNPGRSHYHGNFWEKMAESRRRPVDEPQRSQRITCGFSKGFPLELRWSQSDGRWAPGAMNPP